MSAAATIVPPFTLGSSAEFVGGWGLIEPAAGLKHKETTKKNDDDEASPRLRTPPGKS